MERALLQGERRAELDQVETELEIVNQIQLKLSEVEKNIQREKDKVNTYAHKRNGLHKLINAFFLHLEAFCFQQGGTNLPFLFPVFFS